MAKIQTVSILGCGWLGTALASALLDEGYTVKGSVMTPKRAVKDPKIILFNIQVNQDIVGGREMSDFFDTDCLVWMIPFKRTLVVPETYTEQVEVVLKQLQKTPVPHFIFVGSTSIYPHGQRTCSEDHPVVPETRRGQVLLASEQLCLSQSQISAAVLRVGGLHGYDRNSRRFLESGPRIERPEAPVNLIHRDDCVGIIKALVKQKKTGVFNLVATQHPTRRDFYSRRARQLGLPCPEFEDSLGTGYKLVLNDKVRSMLNYEIFFPDPMTWK